MFIQTIDPVLFQLGPFEVRYYGIVFALSFVAAYFFIKHLAKERKLGMSSDDVADYLTYLILGIVLGARLFDVFVYEPAYYLSNPLQILAVWKGGLSVHGGIIGAIIAGYIYSQKKKINFWKLADITVIPTAFGLIFWRIANFTNSEFPGRITDVPWAVKFLNAYPEHLRNDYRHPVQIYEALKNLFIFSFLWIGRKGKHKDGHFFWLFLFLYSSIRFFLEFYKEWSSFYFGLSIPQIISIPIIIISAYFVYKSK